MEIERPHATLPTPEELQNLSKLKATIERVIADGRLTEDEYACIKSIVWEDHKVTPNELELVRTLINEKIRSGELEWSY